MFEEDKLEQIKLRKAQATLDSAKKDSWGPIVLTDESFPLRSGQMRCWWWIFGLHGVVLAEWLDL